MADVDFSSVSPALEQKIRRKIVTQFNRSDVLLNLVQKVVGGGKNLAWDVSVGTGTGQVFDDGQNITVFNNDTEVLATLPWAELGDTFKITGRAEDAAADSETELGRLFMFKLMQARTRAALKGNTDLYTGAGTSPPQQLYGLMLSGGPLDSTGTYAGLARGTYSQWAGNVLANGGVPRALTLSLIEYAFEVVFTASGLIPTMGVTTPNIWRLLSELVGSETRRNQDAYVRGQKLTVSMGFHSVEVNGIPIFRDSLCPSGSLLLLNEDHVAIEYLPPAPSRIQRGKVIARVPIAGTMQEQTDARPPGTPLLANLIQLPSNGNFDAWMLDATCQVKVDKPNSHVWIKDIAVQAA